MIIDMKIIRLGGRDYPIVDFRVWWHATGYGLVTDYDEILPVLETNPTVEIHATPVAVASCGIYEVLT